VTASLRIGVIGYGYWGPNLVRNFATGARTKVVAIADANPSRRQLAQTSYPHIRVVDEAAALIADPEVDAVVIATPIFSHYDLAKAALLAGKHVLVEKPLTPSVAQAEELAALATKQKRVLMVDHTFVYTGAVKKIRELVQSGELGRVLYFDSVRINLGLFQPDFNVIWDLAPHDLTIMDHVLQSLNVSAKWVSAIGASHYDDAPRNIKVWDIADGVKLGKGKEFVSMALTGFDKAGFAESRFFTTEFVGLGPYRMIDWQRGSHVEGARFDDYYQGRPALDTIVVRSVLVTALNLDVGRRMWWPSELGNKSDGDIETLAEEGALVT